jgi:hypothetical protein
VSRNESVKILLMSMTGIDYFFVMMMMASEISWFVKQHVLVYIKTGFLAGLLLCPSVCQSMGFLNYVPSKG